MIPYGRQHITQADIQAVSDVLKSDFLTQGPTVPRFEQAIARWAGAQHGVALNSATSALHVACLALGLGPGDVLWTTPITFVASANCALYCGARVDFVDIDPDTFTMSPRHLEDKLRKAARDGCLPKVIVPVHMCGQSCDMAAIGALAKTYNIRVIEDASHAIGGLYQNQPVGCCAHSDITVFSFHPVKIITTAEGGMALTNSADLAKHMARLRSHGITRDPADMTCPPDGPWYYQQIELGMNYRMTDMQAALGLSQLERLEEYVTRRNVLAERYDRLLAHLPIDLPSRLEGVRSAFHLYVIRLRNSAHHRAVFEGLRAAGIGVNLHYIPVHLQPYYTRMGFAAGDFPAAEHYYQRAISLPLFAIMTEAEQDQVIQALQELVQG